MNYTTHIPTTEGWKAELARVTHLNCSHGIIRAERLGQDYRLSTAQKMSVDIDATPHRFLLIQKKLCIVQY